MRARGATEPGEPTEPTTATVVLVVGEALYPIALVRSPTCDLTLIAELLRLRLHVRRLGWSVELRDADERLRHLLEFIGFGPDAATPLADDG
jgi:hypothetical protein